MVRIANLGGAGCAIVRAMRTQDDAPLDNTDATSSVAVNLLWTGGWDSTFRLLQLLLLHRVPVVPYYLADPGRASTRIELETMARISTHLRQRHPHTRPLLQSIRVTAVGDVLPHPDITSALREVRRRLYIGDQYAWLPAFCRHQGIDDMELGVHVDDRVQRLLQALVTAYRHPAGFQSVRVDPRHVQTPEFRLFRDFSFPLFQIDKRSIDTQARARGWSEIMEMTWFCHTPVRGQPCGVCAPCVFTIEEGLARRVPASRRAASVVYRRLAFPLIKSFRQVRASVGA